jgi:hypothetical protein
VKPAILAVATLVLLGGCDRRMYAGAEGLQRRVDRAIPQIEEATGLKFKTPPTVQSRSRGEVRDFLVTKFNEATPAQQLRGEEVAYKLFGLLPDTMDLRRYLLELLTEQVVGYYDPATKVLYIVDGIPEDILSVTVSHELVHALQDQYVNLDSVQKLKGNSDRAAAAQAVFEGQATYAQMVSMIGASKLDAVLEGGWEAVRQSIRESRTAMPLFSSAPMVIQESLLFPYLGGAEYVRRYERHRPKATVLDSIPASTEQILSEAAMFPQRDQPVTITLPRSANAETVHEETMGQFGTRLFVYQHGKNLQDAVNAASGWDGDRYRVVRVGDEAESGLVWVTAWDTPTDAAQFVDAVGQGIGRRYRTGAASVSRRGVRTYAGRTRTVVITPVEVAGRSVVMYVDVPTGTSPSVLDPTRITIGR